MTTDTAATDTAVPEVSGAQWASEKAVVEAVLGRRPGVQAADANPVAQTAPVIYDPATHLRCGAAGVHSRPRPF